MGNHPIPDAAIEHADLLDQRPVAEPVDEKFSLLAALSVIVCPAIDGEIASKKFLENISRETGISTSFPISGGGVILLAS
jgi:hypothetical protein